MLVCHGSVLSRFGASGKPGAVHSSPTRSHDGATKRDPILVIRAAVAAVLVALTPHTAIGQGSTPPTAATSYQPNNAVQSPPLRVQVLDATTFRDIETRVRYRLYGIDACAPGQLARLGRQDWPCGVMATAWLVTATLNKWLACRTIEQDGTVNLVRCSSAEHPDLALDMLRDGMAVNSPPRSGATQIRAYLAAEEEARKAYRGLWYSAFQMPWDYRAERAQGVPADAARQTDPMTNDLELYRPGPNIPQEP